MKISRIVITLGIALVCWPALLGCFTENHQTRVSKGAQLTIITSTPRITQEIAFTHENEIRRLVAAPDKTLVAVYLGIVNADVGEASLYIDSDAATLRDTNYKTYPVKDPFADSEVVQSPSKYTDAQLSEYIPLLWGNQSLMRDYQITGFLIFETPTDREWQSLEWHQGDSIVAKFPE
jgi:hypothetical protein